MVKLIINTTDNKKTLVSLEKNGEIHTEESEQSVGSQVLLGLIEKILEKGKVGKEDITEIELSTGPGSFTGLKVGASVANALAFSLGIKVNNKAIETEINY